MILSLLEQKGAESVQIYIMVRVIAIMVCWLFVAISVLIDFWSGVSTARALGEPIKSDGFRRTVIKMADYVRILIFAVMFDALGICFVHTYILPFATVICAIAILLIEGKSVIENSRRKNAHAAEIPEVIKNIINAATTKQATAVLKEITKSENG